MSWQILKRGSATPSWFGNITLTVVPAPRCACGALVRPNVCWFGEQPYHLDRIYDALERCEIFIAIGTSGSVQPVASFVTMLKQKPQPARTVFLGLTEPANARYFDEVHLGPAAELVPQVARLLDKL
jgi:NAD-dependent deacetylase